jgi:hypothetical protein
MVGGDRWLLDWRLKVDGVVIDRRWLELIKVNDNPMKWQSFFFKRNEMTILDDNPMKLIFNGSLDDA